MIQKIPTPVGIYAVHEITPFRQDKETLVCLHGFMGTSQSFNFLNKQTDFNVLAIDLIGHGHSEPSLEASHYTLKNISRAIEIILESLELSSIYLLGYSFGGRVALTYAHNYPKRIKHLFLESSSFGLKTSKEKMERQLKDSQLAQQILDCGMDPFVDNWQKSSLFASQQLLPKSVINTEVKRKKLQQKETMSLALQHGSLATQDDFLKSETISRIPITYLAGRLDKKYTQLGQEAVEKIDVNLIIIENAGHCIHLEEPQFVTDIIYAVIYKQVLEIESISAKEFELELTHPFKTSYGELKKKKTDIFIVKSFDGFEGYGELLSFEAPDYIEETLYGDRYIIQNFLVPLLKNKKIYSPRQVRDLFQPVKGNEMAKSALETAVWDLFAKRKGVSLREYLDLPMKHIPVGVSVGIQESEEALLSVVKGYVEEGYTRVKLKIKKGKDLTYIQHIRNHFPQIMLMVDANSAYHLSDKALLKRLDTFNLELIEQPLGTTDFLEHALLQKELQTSICLDENIRNLGDVKLAHKIGSCQSINLKIPRVGGLREALDILNYAQQENISIWLGGMLESGIGRSLNLILAAHPSFILPGDLSASKRYYQEDLIAEEFVLKHGMMSALKTDSGLGVTLRKNHSKSVNYLD